MSVPAPHSEPLTARDEAAGAASSPAPPAPPTVAPHVHVVRGAPDDLELAALVAGLVATAGPDDEPARGSEWASRRRALAGRPAPAPGPDSWRWSLHP
ncbi:MAG TPA: acyl-CoA carboxylase subunit epsilon [Cellulomonas sp.]